MITNFTIDTRCYNFESDDEDHINGHDLSDLSDIFEDGSEHESGRTYNTVSIRDHIQSLSLDDIPYDRDVKYINIPSSARARALNENIPNRLFRQVKAITGGNIGEIEKLDRHYVAQDQKKKEYDLRFGYTEEGADKSHRRARRKKGKNPKHVYEDDELNETFGINGGESSTSRDYGRNNAVDYSAVRRVPLGDDYSRKKHLYKNQFEVPSNPQQQQETYTKKPSHSQQRQSYDRRINDITADNSLEAPVSSHQSQYIDDDGEDGDVGYHPHDDNAAGPTLDLPHQGGRNNNVKNSYPTRELVDPYSEETPQYNSQAYYYPEAHHTLDDNEPNDGLVHPHSTHIQQQQQQRKAPTQSRKKYPNAQDLPHNHLSHPARETPPPAASGPPHKLYHPHSAQFYQHPHASAHSQPPHTSPAAAAPHPPQPHEASRQRPVQFLQRPPSHTPDLPPPQQQKQQQQQQPPASTSTKKGAPLPRPAAAETALTSADPSHASFTPKAAPTGRSQLENNNNFFNNASNPYLNGSPESGFYLAPYATSHINHYSTPPFPLPPPPLLLQSSGYPIQQQILPHPTHSHSRNPNPSTTLAQPYFSPAQSYQQRVRPAATNAAAAGASSSNSSTPVVPAASPSATARLNPAAVEWVPPSFRAQSQRPAHT